MTKRTSLLRAGSTLKWRQSKAMRVLALLSAVNVHFFFVTKLSAECPPPSNSPLFDALADLPNPLSAVSLRDALQGEYNQGHTKHYLLIRAKMPVRAGGGLGLEALIDLDDYYGISPEGQGSDPYVTVLFRLTGYIAVGLSFPVEIGLISRPNVDLSSQSFSQDNAPDPVPETEVFLGLDARFFVKIWSCNAFPEGGWVINSEKTSTDIGLKVGQIAFPLGPYEMRRDWLNAIINAATFDPLQSTTPHTVLATEYTRVLFEAFVTQDLSCLPSRPATPGDGQYVPPLQPDFVILQTGTSAAMPVSTDFQVSFYLANMGYSTGTAYSRAYIDSPSSSPIADLGPYAATYLEGRSLSFTVPASLLSPGPHSLTIEAYGVDPPEQNSGNDSISWPFAVASPGLLNVSPQSGFTANGLQGGPFNPVTTTYSLANEGDQAFSWSASKAASWVDVSPSSGTLAAGTADSVVVTINSGANSLLPGAYSDNVVFQNVTNGLGNTSRAVNLQVNQPPQPGLSSGSVNPPSGTDLNTFTFSVTFLDPSGQARTLANVETIVTGGSWGSPTIRPMSPVSGSFQAGKVYRLATQLSVGSYQHRFHFRAADGTELPWPSWGGQPGPQVGSPAALQVSCYAEGTPYSPGQHPRLRVDVRDPSGNPINADWVQTYISPPGGVSGSVSLQRVGPTGHYEYNGLTWQFGCDCYTFTFIASHPSFVDGTCTLMFQACACPSLVPMRIDPLAASPSQIIQGVGSTNIGHAINLDARESIQIRNSSGAIVRDLFQAQNRVAGSYSDVWDGLADSNQSVPVGNYLADVKAIHLDSDHSMFTFGVRGTGSCQVNSVRGLTSGPQGECYVLDASASGTSFKLKKFAADGTCAEFVIPTGGFADQISDPAGIVADNRGDIHILNNQPQRRINVWNGNTGQWLRQYATGFMSPSDQPSLTPIIYDPNSDNVLTWGVDASGGGSKVFISNATTGSLVSTLDPLPSDNTHIGATGLAVDGEGNIWIVRYSGPTYVLSPSGQIIRQFSGSDWEDTRILIRWGELVYKSNGSGIQVLDTLGNQLETICINSGFGLQNVHLAGTAGQYLYVADASSCGSSTLYAGLRIKDFNSADRRSTPINVIQGVLTITSPNGGEVWPLGTTKTIQWVSLGSIGNVTVRLFKGGIEYPSVSPIVTNAPNTGEVSWTVTPGLVIGNDYTLRIEASASPGISDVSDAAFAILPRVAVDFDEDGDVDQDDLNTFRGCSMGPAVEPLPQGCQDKDLDGDGDTDLDDFGLFQRCHMGSGNPADPDCMNPGSTPKVATPAFDPPSGSYLGSVSIAISSSTSGTAIRYTTNGTDPTPSNGQDYLGPVSFTASTTLKARGFKPGFADSDVATGLYSIATGGPVQLTYEGTYNTPDNAMGVTVSGDYAYVADASSGLQIINIANPASPQFVAAFDTNGTANTVVVQGGYVYIADRSDGLIVVDVSNLQTPTLAGSLDTPGVPYDVALSGSYAFTAEDSFGLNIIDITNPFSPQPAGSYDTAGLAYGVAVMGNFAYIADRQAGLKIVDISNPLSPQPRGGYVHPGGLAYGVAVAGIHAYVVYQEAGLQVIDVTNPDQPQRVGGAATAYARSVTLSGNHAFVADNTAGVKVIDVTDPAHPVTVGAYAHTTVAEAWAVAVSAGYVYVAYGANGLVILRITP